MNRSVALALLALVLRPASALGVTAPASGEAAARSDTAAPPSSTDAPPFEHTAPPSSTATPPSVATAPPDCSASAAARSPDPRCGESLDGRPPEPTSGGRAVARAVLWVPRGLSRVVFWPVIKATDAVERHHVLDWIQAVLTTDDGKVGARSDVIYSTGFVPTVGLRLFYRRLPGPGSEIATLFETAGSSALLGELDLSGPIWLGLHARAMWNRRNDRLFAGISASSDAALAAASYGTARYGSDIALGKVRWTRSFARRLSAILHVDLQRRDYQSSDVSGGPPVAELFGLPPGTCAAPALSNECVDPTLVPGFQNGLRILHAGAGLTWDARSRARLAGGGSISLNATYGKGVAGDPSQHVTYAGEAVLAVGWVDRAFLLRGRAAMIQALGAAPIPFDELVSPSGNGGMRAFPEGRFRGQSGVVGTAEYRWYIAHNLDASLFTDLGTVGGQDFAELFQNTWFPSFGAGIRLFLIPGQYWEGSAPTGLQVAYAPNSGFRLMLALATF